MKIADVVNMIGVAVTKEERKFVSHHGDNIKLSHLGDREIWIAQNLVRKGLYEISNSTDHITRVKNVFYLRPTI
jgi:hypothetical protein